MVILKACCDETGTHYGARGTTCVGGYVFDQDGERSFTEAWAEILRSRGIEYFHATDCYTKGEFSVLTEAEGNTVFHSLISLVRSTAKLGIVSGIEGAAFAGVINRNKFQSFTGSKYTVCAQRSLTLIKRWADKNEFDGKIFYAFESGNEHMGEADAMMKRIREVPALCRAYRYEDHGFFTKSSLLPLQAADMFLWLYQRVFTHPQIKTEAHFLLQELLKEPGGVPHWDQPITDLSLNMLALSNMSHGIKSKNRKYETQSGPVRKYSC